jgi:uncharacterized protein YaeQ
MALTATIYRVQVALSDVDRGVYEALDLREGFIRAAIDP